VLRTDHAVNRKPTAAWSRSVWSSAILATTHLEHIPDGVSSV
jgi:hypothetical protein